MVTMTAETRVEMREYFDRDVMIGMAHDDLGDLAADHRLVAPVREGE